MGKTVEDICNILIKNIFAASTDFIRPAQFPKTLSACVSLEPINNNPYQALFNSDNLYNTLERTIIKELSLAIDKNSVSKVKFLKNKYGHLKEFNNAKKYLNQKCKEVWNVYENPQNLPKDAMKTLGITNQPELDFILGNSLKYYEKDNSDTTAYIISSTLKNRNLSYTMDDIHRYLKDMAKKSNCKYNFKTVNYLICEQNYTKSKLFELDIDKSTIDFALKKLSLKQKIKYYLNNLRNN